VFHQRLSSTPVIVTLETTGGQDIRYLYLFCYCQHYSISCGFMRDK